MIMRSVLTVLVAAPLWLGTLVPGLAWSEADCLHSCRQTANRYDTCVKNNRCEQYRGQASSGASAVNAHSAKYNAQHAVQQVMGADGVAHNVQRPRTMGQCMSNGINVLGYTKEKTAQHCAGVFSQ